MGPAIHSHMILMCSQEIAHGNIQSPLSGRQRYGSGQGWKHGSYGSADYDYAQSGYRTSGDSRTSRSNSSPLRSMDRAANKQVSRHGKSVSSSDHTGSKATERTGRQDSSRGQSETSHGKSIDSHNHSGSSITRRQGSSHEHSVVTHEKLGKDLLIASQATTLCLAMDNPYHLTAIQNLVQLEGRDPIVIA
ncbi:hypothetical protein HPG69_010599 [Diceros bicornis minor]|uniref:Uncharacterized protein n=1 Tax=Diceros bicornis minor TaxID=77932 RepID=A0A7J7EKH6_DICBM|nr:hypothetical protein HPG69_010599 [Diceros bicornis minor]